MPPLPRFALLSLGFPELLIIILLLGGVAFWVWMIADCATKEEGDSSKVAWMLAIILVGVVGAPLYFFERKLPRKRRNA